MTSMVADAEHAPETPKLRLFVAVVPDRAVLERAAALLTRVRAAGDRAGWRVGWVPAPNLHITLKFLGWVPPDRVGAIDAALRPVTARAPFELRLHGLGAFPPRGKPRVLWIGARGGAGDLVDLARDVEARLEDIGFSREPRPYHPHLTLGRVKSAPGLRGPVLDPFKDADGGVCTVREIVLYRSVLRQPHPDYQALLRIPLTGS
jgi:RNA 2',3'-cyclic 3'-phosphodiesterase